MKPTTDYLERLIDSVDEPSRQMIAIAEIEQSMREWSQQGWHPIEITADNPLDVDAVCERSYKVVVVDGPVPWRRLLRWLRKSCYNRASRQRI